MDINIHNIDSIYYRKSTTVRNNVETTHHEFQIVDGKGNRFEINLYGSASEFQDASSPHMSSIDRSVDIRRQDFETRAKKNGLL